jgi:hypothetical protein
MDSELRKLLKPYIVDFIEGFFKLTVKDDLKRNRALCAITVLFREELRNEDCALGRLSTDMFRERMTMYANASIWFIEQEKFNVFRDLLSLNNYYYKPSKEHESDANKCEEGIILALSKMTSDRELFVVCKTYLDDMKQVRGWGNT